MIEIESEDAGPSNDSTPRPKLKSLCVRWYRYVISESSNSANTNKLGSVSHRPRFIVHEAVERGDIDTVKMLVQDEVRDINTTDERGNTPLHLAVKLKHAKIMKILLDRSDLAVNEINDSHQTPLQLALTCKNVKIIKILLTRADVDVDNVEYDGKSCRDKIRETYPDIYLFTLLYRRETEEFVELAEANIEQLKYDDDGKYTSLQVACKNELTSVVQMLLQLNVGPNSRCGSSDPPLLMAAFQGCYSILEILLKHSDISLAMVNGRNVLHALLHGIEKCQSARPDKDHDYYRCLELLLSEQVLPKVDINAQDGEGNTILHLAARLDDDDIVRMILKTSIYVGSKNNKNKYAFEYIKPSIIEEWLNGCVSANEVRSDDENYAIIMDYGNLAPTKPCKYSLAIMGLTILTIGVCESQPLLELGGMKHLRHVLLKHPLLMTFFHLKWLAIRKFFFMNLLYYLTFLLILSWYVFDRFTPLDLGIFSVTNSDGVFLTRSIVLCFFVIMMMIRELSQLVITRFSYFTCLDNWLEMILIGSSLLSITYSLDRSRQIDSNDRIYAALAILISWSEAILLVGRHPKCSTYVEMFKKVTIDFCKFLLWYSTFIFAFAFAFYVLYCNAPAGDSTGNQNETLGNQNGTLGNENGTLGNQNGTSGNQNGTFETLPLSVFKTIIMMTGEFDTSSIPFQAGERFDRVIFLTFIFLIAVVLVSLLNGLAVSDIQDIKDDAEVVGIMSRVKLIGLTEGMVIGGIFDKLGQCLCLWNQVRNFFRISFFPDLLIEKKAYVFPNLSDLVLFDLSSSIVAKKYERRLCLCGKLLLWRMDSDVVESCKAILNEKDLSKVIDHGETVEKYDLKMEKYESKMEDFQRALNRNEIVLKEMMDILKKKS